MPELFDVGVPVFLVVDGGEEGGLAAHADGPGQQLPVPLTLLRLEPLKMCMSYCPIIRVFQRAIGTERMKSVAATSSQHRKLCTYFSEHYFY